MSNATDPNCLFTYPYLIGNEQPFDVQVAEPGSFIEPWNNGTLIRGTNATTPWLFFKGDMMAGPTPDHPFEGYDNQVKWSLDLVAKDNTSHVFHEIMSPTNSDPFWRSWGPFGTRDGEHMLWMWRFKNESCRFNKFATMDYTWTVPEGLPVDTQYRIKLSTDEPASERTSDLFQVTKASRRPICGTHNISIHRIETYKIIYASLALVLILWIAYRLCSMRRCKAKTTVVAEAQPKSGPDCEKKVPVGRGPYLV